VVLPLTLAREPRGVGRGSDEREEKCAIKRGALVFVDVAEA
jgi:hypothetical protein